MDIKNLTPEQEAKARECKSPEDLIALAKAEGYELSDQELEAVSGGNAWDDIEEFLDHDCNTDID